MKKSLLKNLVTTVNRQNRVLNLLQNNKGNRFKEKLKFSGDLFYDNQISVLYNYLQNNLVTASMAAKATGIPQKNICRYKRDLEKAGLLFEVEKRKCRETGHLAWYITTNLKYLV